MHHALGYDAKPMLRPCLAATAAAAIALTRCSSPPPPNPGVSEDVRAEHAVPYPTGCHSQGIAASSRQLFMSCMRNDNRAIVAAYALPDGYPLDGGALTLLRETDLTRGTQIHPSGLDLDDECLWVAVAENKASTSSTVMCLDPDTLAVKREWPYADHLGTVAVIDGELATLNWDSKSIIRFARDGTHLGTLPGTGRAYQDCEGRFCVSQRFNAFAKGVAMVDELQLDGGTWVVASHVERTHPDTGLGKEGFAALDSYWYFLPDDSPGAKVYVYDRP